MFQQSQISFSLRRDICDCRKVSVKLPRVYVCLSSRDLFIFSVRVSSFFPYFCSICTSVLSLSTYLHYVDLIAKFISIFLHNVLISQFVFHISDPGKEFGQSFIAQLVFLFHRLLYWTRIAWVDTDLLPR